MAPLAVWGRRVEVPLEKGWRFFRGDDSAAFSSVYDDSAWEEVEVPHDWAIYGPFDRSNDLQDVAVTQNLETAPSLKTGRTGGLPYVGTGWYRCRFDVPQGKRVSLVFGGAMSNAQVFVNGVKVCTRPYGYVPFHCDVSSVLAPDGKDNVLAVRLENRPQSSRWYPGAGLYRSVKLVMTDSLHIPVWGTCVRVDSLSQEGAVLEVAARVEGLCRGALLTTSVVSPDGDTVAVDVSPASALSVCRLEVPHPQLWTPQTPDLYKVVSVLSLDGEEKDRYETVTGIRTVAAVPGRGFLLNGRPHKFRGVCNHHDLGPLGAAVNVSALRYRLKLLKDMGCDAVRTAHNMPSGELVSLCDEMGLMVMVEAFDEWALEKCSGGYHLYFDEWAEKDMENMLLCFRNSPSVVMWSIGNEVPEQYGGDGREVAAMLQGICHRLDPTRPVTCGMDQVAAAVGTGFGAVLDVPGLNYRPHLYEYAYEGLPQKMILGSETASTVSSRGVYKFPVISGGHIMHDDNQSSSYDIEYCSWSNVPDDDFALAEDWPWTMGQFVWTGFDYLGEPSPYDTDAWPSHSSLFGIIDLGGIPKDRYYLYRSVWNSGSPTLHVLPHWTWPGMEGKNVPVFVYTNRPSAELFVNGVSQGVRTKLSREQSLALEGKDPFWKQRRFRLIWEDVVYSPGEIRVVACGDDGRPVQDTVVRTASVPARLELVPSADVIAADGKDLCFVRVRMVDRDGNLCPSAGALVGFEVSGCGSFRAAANGDPTCLDAFHLPQMHLFGGELMLVVQAGDRPGKIRVRARSEGVKDGTITIKAR